MTIPADGAYVYFIKRQLGQVEHQQARILGLSFLLLLLVLFLLIFLRSPAPVWVYILLLVGLALYGMRRLQTALRITRIATQHLLEVAELLKGQPERERLIALLRERSTPNDLSNVPEALLSLSAGQVTGERIRVAANSAFTRPVSELSYSAYLRTAMMLFGLFGTVFFFAYKLQGANPGVALSGDLLPFLRGALVSTLTGILGSVAIGISASGLERLLDLAVWETEAFLGGDFNACVSQARPKTPPVNEAELWESLRQEVETMTREAREAYQRMGDDAHSFATALNQLSQQLGQLPAVTVPQDLGRLGDAASEFARAMGPMKESVSLLVDTVGKLEIFAPAWMLTQMDQVQRELGEARQMTAKAAEEVAEQGRRNDGRFERFSRRLDRIPEEMTGRFDAVGASVLEVGKDVRAGTTAVQRMQGDLAQAQDALTGSAEQVQGAASRLESVGGGLTQVAHALGDAAQQSAEAAEALRREAGRIAEIADGTRGLSNTVKTLGVQVASVQRSTDRALGAPLMRLLLLHLWPFGRRERVPNHDTEP